jgi:hypothetical protein
MATPESARPDQPPHVLVAWSEYVAVVRGSISDRYARFYAPMAIGSIMIAFLPLFEDVVVVEEWGTRSTEYGSVFDMAGRPGGGPAVIGVFLLAGLVAALALAVFRVRSAVLPGMIAGLSALIVLMLLTKPGTGDPTPDLTGSGLAGLVLAVCATLLGITHAIHLSWFDRSDERQRPGGS